MGVPVHVLVSEHPGLGRTVLFEDGYFGPEDEGEFLYESLLDRGYDVTFDVLADSAHEHLSEEALTLVVGLVLGDAGRPQA